MNLNASLTTCLLALFFLIAAAFPTTGKAQFGLSAGLNFNQLDEIETETIQADLRNTTGYHFGIFYDLALGPVALRPGIMYRHIGDYRIANIDLPDQILEYDLNVIDVPIDLRLRLLPQSPVSPYLLAGPVISFPQAEDEFDDGVEDVGLSADIGAGLSIEIPSAAITLMPELRYEIGTTPFIQDEFEVGDATIRPQDSPRLNSFVLRLNVRF